MANLDTDNLENLLLSSAKSNYATKDYSEGSYVVEWLDEPDLGFFSVSRELPDSKPSGEPEPTTKPIRPSLEEVQSVFFGGNIVLRPLMCRKNPDDRNY
jgi:hypothetical protein